jgi:DNA-binding transcriptional regulator YhcF (GntR family)
MRSRKLDPAVVLSVVAWYTEKIGYPPTYRELAVELAVAPSTIALALGELEAAGKITREAGRTRTLRIVA